MARKLIIEQDTPSVSDTVIEVVSSLGGIALGISSGWYLNQLLPAAATTMEEVVRKSAVGIGSFTIGVTGSKAIQSEMEDARDAAIMAKLAASGLLTQQDAKVIEEEKKEVGKTSAKK